MDDAAGTATSACYEQPESHDDSDPAAAGTASCDARKLRAELWPPEVSSGARKVFSRPHTLRYGGKTYQLEIRSSKSKGFWIMVDGAVVSGATNAIALANVLKAIDPEGKVVRDTRGRVLA